jgi:hypothetical protein
MSCAQSTGQPAAGIASDFRYHGEHNQGGADSSLHPVGKPSGRSRSVHGVTIRRFAGTLVVVAIKLPISSKRTDGFVDTLMACLCLARLVNRWPPTDASHNLATPEVTVAAR